MKDIDVNNLDNLELAELLAIFEGMNDSLNEMEATIKNGEE